MVSYKKTEGVAALSSPFVAKMQNRAAPTLCGYLQFITSWRFLDARMHDVVQLGLVCFFSSYKSHHIVYLNTN